MSGRKLAFMLAIGILQNAVPASASPYSYENVWASAVYNHVAYPYTGLSLPIHI